MTQHIGVNEMIRLLTFAALLSIFFGTIDPAAAEIVKKDIEYSKNGTKFVGYYAFDDSAKGKRPAILVTHDWLGITEKTKAVVDRLAAMGYAAFAVDIYGKGVRPTEAEASQIAGKYKSDRKLLRERMNEGFKAMLKQAEVDASKTVAIGYCFGGTAALELARSGASVKGVVSFHGGLDSPNPQDGKKIKAKVLALHGADDPFVPAVDLEKFEKEMRESKVDWQLVKYGGAVHSFTDKTAGSDPSKGAAYQESADRRSWQDMQNFFTELF